LAGTATFGVGNTTAAEAVAVVTDIRTGGAGRGCDLLTGIIGAGMGGDRAGDTGTIWNRRR